MVAGGWGVRMTSVPRPTGERRSTSIPADRYAGRAGLFAAMRCSLRSHGPAGKPTPAVVAEERVSQVTIRLPTVEVVGRRAPELAAHAASKRKASG
jgi:hypothetical protein